MTPIERADDPTAVPDIRSRPLGAVAAQAGGIVRRVRDKAQGAPPVAAFQSSI